MSHAIFAHTGTTEKVKCLTWKVDNFVGERLWRNESTVTGPDITIPTQPPSVWNPVIEKKEMSVSEGFLYIFRCQPLERLELQKEFQLEFELSFQDVEGNCISKFHRVVEKGIRIVFATSSLYLLNHKSIFGLLVNNDLILKCCFKVIRCSTSCRFKEDISPEYDFQCLLDNVRALYISKELCDFTIVVNDKKFCVHKCILASRSPVFAAMFKRHTLESIKNKLVVKDFDNKTMELFLFYMYTGQFNDELSVEQYFQLYSIADKYEVVPLITTCAHKLIKCISADNVCDIYALGYYHSDIILSFAANRYISENTSSVLLGENWRKITLQNSEVALAILKEHGLS